MTTIDCSDLWDKKREDKKKEKFQGLNDLQIMMLALVKLFEGTGCDDEVLVGDLWRRINK